VPAPTGEAVTIEGERVSEDQQSIIMPDGEVISNVAETESAPAGD
jgi:hypothetical protein